MRNPLQPNLKTELFPLLLLFSSFVASFYFYQHLPDQVAVHWNQVGQPDGYAGRFFAAFFFPGLNLIIYLLMLFIPVLDPRKENYRYFAPAYHLVKAGLVFFFWLLYLVVALKNLGYYLPIEVIVPFLVGLLFVLIGFNLNNIKPNYFFGIRTPWTLYSSTVWQRTHKFGSKVFIVGGVLMCLSVALSTNLIYFIILTALVLAAVIIYSYWAYCQE